MANFPSNTQVHGHTLSWGLSLFLLILFTFEGYGQSPLSSQNKKAVKLYTKGQEKAKDRDFESALVFFSDAIEQDKKFYEAYLRRASLYNAMGKQDSVYSNFKVYLEISPTPAKTVIKRAIQLAFDRGEYASANKYLTQFLEVAEDSEVDREIKLLSLSIPFALEQVVNEVSLDIIPLPKAVNRFALQYLPSITIDNSTLIYTKRDFISGDEDIVVSNFENEKWSAGRSISSKINTSLNEGASTISADGKTLMYTSCDKRDSFGSCDIYISRLTAEGWTRPKNLGKAINTHYWESQPSLSADGKTLYFSSNRPGGSGGRDLWVSNFDDEQWTKPLNLGPQVNTFKDETTPFIHSNGETLYFSSNGHIGMGGYDLMKSELKDSLWTTTVNLGYPINSFHDEVALLIGGDGETAYFAKEKQMDQQIVESNIVSFQLPNELKAKSASYIIGKVIDFKTKGPLKATVEVIDLDKTEKIFEVKSDEKSGDYTMVLPSGKNLVWYVKRQGYLFFESNYYTQINTPVNPDTVDIELKPIALNESIVLKNIYFEVDSYDLDPKSISELINVTELLNENPQISVEISGHTDNSGLAEYNQALSENRAKSVINEIVDLGIDPERLAFKGFGASQPIASNETKEGRKSNRRIEFRVLRLRP